ncbi:MAG TPA: DNA gyrase inhibitor YacG [Geobacteraceae bacterium]|nr:DNA gyrase inhibitor YacG [Geobacteraceae bacterium]
MIVNCPVCGKEKEWSGNPFRPFCSERCKNIDLAAWASGEYRISGEKKRDGEGDEEPEDG